MAVLALELTILNSEPRTFHQLRRLWKPTTSLHFSTFVCSNSCVCEIDVCIPSPISPRSHRVVVDSSDTAVRGEGASVHRAHCPAVLHASQFVESRTPMDLYGSLVSQKHRRRRVVYIEQHFHPIKSYPSSLSMQTPIDTAAAQFLPQCGCKADRRQFSFTEGTLMSGGGGGTVGFAAAATIRRQ